MSTSSVYRIRNGKGLWSNGGTTPSFSARGKAWVSRGALTSHLRIIAEKGYYEEGDKSRPWRKLTNKIPDDWEIVEFIIVETNSDLITPATVVVDKMRRREILEHDHGSAFASLVERLESKDLSLEYPWVLSLKSFPADSENLRFLELIKTSKLKRQSDIHIAQDRGNIAVAFKDKSKAMMIRLAWTGKITAVNLKDYEEVDLDN